MHCFKEQVWGMTGDVRVVVLGETLRPYCFATIYLSVSPAWLRWSG
jgi:hypothetical protein